MPENTSVFQLPERIKENIVEENLATREELEDTIVRAMSGDLKAWVELSDVCYDYFDILDQKLEKAEQKFYTELCNNKEHEIVKKIADTKLDVYNDEIKREFFNEDYSGKYQNVINDLREEVKEEAEQELYDLVDDKKGTIPFIKNLEYEIDDLKWPLINISDALSYQQYITARGMKWDVLEKWDFVFDTQKEEGYFPSFADKYYGMNFTHIEDKIALTNNNDLIEKFNLLANLQLPEREGLPQNDKMTIVSISDIKGDFDKDGNLHLQSMAAEQGAAVSLVPYTQKLSFDFQTGTLHVTGLEQKEESASQYAYYIPIETVDGRILALQKELAFCKGDLSSLDWIPSIRNHRRILCRPIPRIGSGSPDSIRIYTGC